jgi:hypothetical protein
MTKNFDAEIDIGGILLTVSGTYTPAVKPYTTGLPEDCHDGSCGEINSITQVCDDIGEVISVTDCAEFQRCWEEAIWDGIKKDTK